MRRINKKLFLCILVVMIQQPIVRAEVYKVEGVLGSGADVPCRVSPQESSDKINLILWYKNEDKDPIYSYDSRLTVFPSEHHHLKNVDLQGRIEFFASTRREIPHKLRINKLRASDAGKYSCRVDFKKAQSTTISMKLVIVTPVESLTIADGAGNPVLPVLSPIPEGGVLNLTCVAVGGKPQPNVTWWLGGAKMDESWEVVSKTVVTNTLVISPLSRSYAYALLECQAASSSVAIATASVTIDMHYPHRTCPVQRHYCPCQSETINWKTLTGVSAMSHVRLQVSRQDNGIRIFCRAINPKLPGYMLTENVLLNVTYAPQVELKLGDNVKKYVVQEKTNLYLTCNVDANPRSHNLVFLHQGMEVRPSASKGIVVTGSDLVLRNIHRTQSGAYTCKATNIEGHGTSNAVNISVLYAPVCTASPNVWAEPGTQVNASCKVTASPTKDTNFSWVWQTPTSTLLITPAYVTSTGTESRVVFVVPRDNSSMSRTEPEHKLGELQCWAKNSVGRQDVPCTIAVRRPAKPMAPANCTLSKPGLEVVKVICESVASKSMPHFYKLHIYEANTRTLYYNLTSSYPRFIVRGLRLGQDYEVYISTHTQFEHSDPRLVEAFTFKMAENRMREDEEEEEEDGGESRIQLASWSNILMFLGAASGLVLIVILGAAIVRLRLNRSTHKCTVRAPNHKTDITELTPPKDTALPSNKIPSAEEKKPAVTESLHPHLAHDSPVDEPISPVKTLQPIIRQNRPPPIIKEPRNELATKPTSGRTVLFLEPPKSHFTPLPNKEIASRGYYDSPYASKKLASYTLAEDREYAVESPSRYSQDFRYRNALHAHNLIDTDEVLDTQFSSCSSNALSREPGYCSPRQPYPSNRRSNSTAMHHPDSPPLYYRPRDPVLDRPRDPILDRFRDPVLGYRRQRTQKRGGSLDCEPVPLSPPLQSIMKKSSSLTTGVSRNYDFPRSGETRYRSLPRPGKPREVGTDAMAKYRSLDRRFDLPFTGSLPRPISRNTNDQQVSEDFPDAQKGDAGSSRSRLTDEKLYHVYAKRKQREDVDESFV